MAKTSVAKAAAKAIPKKTAKKSAAARWRPRGNEGLKLAPLPANFRSDALLVGQGAPIAAPPAAPLPGPGLEPAAHDVRTTAFADLSASLSSVTRPGDFPWSAHVQLQMVGPDGARKVGSGCVIGDKTIITAGHCVHDGGWMREIHVSLGGSRSGLPQRLPAIYWNSTTEWIHGATPVQREAGDMGVVRVAESLAAFTAPLRYACYDTARLHDIQARRLAVSVAGFPVDPWDSFLVDAGVLTGVSGDFLLYDVETFKGQSGAPLLFWDEDGQPTVLGIHHWNVALNRNRAVRLSEPAAALLLNWTA